MISSRTSQKKGEGANLNEKRWTRVSITRPGIPDDYGAEFVTLVGEKPPSRAEIKAAARDLFSGVRAKDLEVEYIRGEEEILQIETLRRKDSERGSHDLIYPR